MTAEKASPDATMADLFVARLAFGGLMLGIPRCQKCGKFADRRCIDGDWWPPCGCGIQHLKYECEK